MASISLLGALLLLGLSALCSSQPTVQKAFIPKSQDINLIDNTVKLPLHRAVLPDNTTVYFIVLDSSTADAAQTWGVTHTPILANAKDSAVVQRVSAVDGAPPTAAAVGPSQVLQVNATVDFLHGKRSVAPDPVTGFPPSNFSYSAQGNKGYSPLLQLPDGTVLNAPHVAVVLPGGKLALHPKVVSVAPDRSSVVFELTQGFSGGQPIVYISTEASDPLAATLENVPYVPLLAKTPQAVLVDLVAFTNGQTGKSNPQRQGLGSALKDGLGPLNIAANTPASPAYSPLWAINLAKWVGSPGDRQTSVAAVQTLAAAGKVASFNPNDSASNPPLGPSGIVVNCPVIATVLQPDANISAQFVASASDINLINNTVTLPLHHGMLPNGTDVYYIVTEASTPEAARAWGVSHAAALAAVKNTSVVQKALKAMQTGRNSSTTGNSSMRALLAEGAESSSSPLSAGSNATASPAAAGAPYSAVEVEATVDFMHGKRSVVPNPDTGFPPENFTYSAQGDPGYSPLLQLPDGTILNAPHVAVVRPGGKLALHPKVVSVAPDRSSVVFELTQGFSEGQPIVYISTDASDPLAATLENVVYVPLLAKTPQSALIGLVAFTNGQTGKSNPQRQGLGSALKDGLGPLNIAANTPASPAYSPLWAINLAKWVGSPGDRQTSVAAVEALAAAGKVASFNPNDPASNPPLGPSGIVVNCPIIATVKSDTAAAAGRSASGSGCTPSPLGYSCVAEAQPGVSIHYSLGGGKPPMNACTSSSMTINPDSPAGATAAAGQQGQQRLAHFAVEAATPGFVAMSFPQTAGKMWPADAVIGFDGADGTNPDVHSYHLTHYGVAPSDATNGWAFNQGYVSQGGKKVVCFSRALDSPAAEVVKSINADAPLPINWAISTQNALAQHSQQGSLAINLAGGGASITSGEDAASATAYRVAHGTLMLTAFVLLMPAAVVMARHKWLFGDKETGMIRPGWFKIHQGANIAAVVLALTAAALIFARFQWAGRADTAPYYAYHRAFGMTALAMMVVQGLLGAVRPHLGTKARPVWRRVHQAWGWLTLLVGTGVSYMGISLIHDLSGLPLAYWLGPALTVTGLMLLAGLLLEVRKLKLQQSGNYDKDSHTVAAAAALPIKSTLQGSNAVEAQPMAA